MLHQGDTAECRGSLLACGSFAIGLSEFWPTRPLLLMLPDHNRFRKARVCSNKSIKSYPLHLPTAGSGHPRWLLRIGLSMCVTRQAAVLCTVCFTLYGLLDDQCVGFANPADTAVFSPVSMSLHLFVHRHSCHMLTVDRICLPGPSHISTPSHSGRHTRRVMITTLCQSLPCITS